ncbi:protein of unknown function [Taphrina deformans PYCC 5710]|uniref:Glutaminase GtaA n=1 Tax=Taphrina deformans (strain PYCC 5710 / ATCC 11124 / CBS 356.35 / IMI 108563 / JCM 9778 / NBRC 8474) TaxID=1097556 RepID=R4XE18_TAPDE|nr:protein of unknown function [Taphrina deformans PYCC 5710]|eukprot:CCG84065.1 protein of unknown function [Taphrina deformans PYCC 5710]
MRLLGSLFLRTAKVAILCHIVLAAALKSVPLRPPSYPLAVRSPYLSTWVQGSHEGIYDQSPEFWNGQKLGWTGLVRINETIYSLFGAIPQEISTKRAKQIKQTYTPSRSVFEFFAGGIHFELIFSNPLTPEDYKRQTIPISYLEVVIGANHEYDAIDVYFDVNGAWLSGDTSNFISWDVQAPDHKIHNGLYSHMVRRTSQLLFTEIDDMAEWGVLYWTTSDTHHLSTCAGASASKTRHHFRSYGNLSNTVDTEFRPVNLEEPVFAFAKSFGRSKHRQSSLYTIGLIQEEVLQVNLPKDGYATAYPLYKRYFKKINDMVQWHYHDYRHHELDKFAQQVVYEAGRIDDKYAMIIAISGIQAMGGTQLVINSEDPSGEPHLWMKEISSDGNMQTSDVMYPAMPFFLYANPKLLVAMLEPLLIHQEAGLYPNKYAMHDMGSSYPNATGHPDGNDEYMPVEECGNNLIMMLATHDALVEASQDGQEVAFARAWLERHYRIALQWTEYLVRYGLVTESQLSTDDFAGTLANQTNLAVKAIVGIKCMSVIAGIAGHQGKSSELEETAAAYTKRWLRLAYDEGVPFAKLAYQWKGSWGSLYNLYGDRLLNLQTFPDIVYETQDAWYTKVLAPYGLPLDSRHLYTKSDWEMFIASFSSPALYPALYHRLAAWINDTTTRRPLIDLYDTVTGTNAVNMFTNRPVVGGHFAHLFMDKMQRSRGKIDRTRSSHAGHELLLQNSKGRVTVDGRP